MVGVVERQENQTIQGLAGTANLAAWAQLVSLIVGAVALLLTVGMVASRDAAAGIAAVLMGAVVGGFLLVINGYLAMSLFNSSKYFQAVVDTQGNDIPNLMEALKHQNNLFSFLRTLTLIAFVVFFMACFAGMFLAVGAR